MKIIRRHLKYLIERYLFEEDEEKEEENSEEKTKEEKDLDQKMGLNDFVSKLGKEGQHELPDATKAALQKVADRKTSEDIKNDEKSYDKDEFTKTYGHLATAAYNKGYA